MTSIADRVAATRAARLAAALLPPPVREMPESESEPEPEPETVPRSPTPAPRMRAPIERTESVMVRVVNSFRAGSWTEEPARVEAYDEAVHEDREAAEFLREALASLRAAEKAFALMQERVAVARVRATRASADRIAAAAGLSPAEVLRVVDRDEDSLSW